MTSETTLPNRGEGGHMRIPILIILLALVPAMLCFCSYLPAVILASFVFNALFLGSRLFSALAQEREKRTLDSLRLTQLSSLDILLWKSQGELRTWKLGNILLLGLSILAATFGHESILWAVAGTLALATSGLLSIALALAVSTRCQTTSSAVVSGWITKGVWLAGLPLLDGVIEAVFVLSRKVDIACYLDPAWIALRVVESAFYETGGMPIIALLIGAAASAVGAYVLIVGAARLIDNSFESGALLEDRERHPAYRSSFLGKLSANPFFVREMAWQMRSGAGSWPGYALFLTLFLAPTFYGIAQEHNVRGERDIKIVRQDVQVPHSQPSQPSQPVNVRTNDGCHTVQTMAQQNSAPKLRVHSGICLSQMMGLPVPLHHTKAFAPRVIVDDHGNVKQVSEATFRRIEAESLSSAPRPERSRSVKSELLKREVTGGLLTGLLLSIIYVFLRGGAFLAGSITGEKERRAWDQIALTGVSADTYLTGKLAGVLAYPLRQLALTSPALLFFVALGDIGIFQAGLTVMLLLVCFLTAGTMGMAASVNEKTSHVAQGSVLILSAALIGLPLLPGGWIPATFLLMAALLRSRASSKVKSIGACSLLGFGLVFGAATSPATAVMALCGSVTTPLGPLLTMVVAITYMVVLGLGAYRVAVSSLEYGGSVQA